MVVGEADGTISVPVTLSAPSATAVTVNANVANGTAIAGTAAGAGIDYLCPYSSCNTGTVTFAANQTTPATISIPIVEDPTASGNKSFTVNLSSPSSNAVLARASTRVNIVDNQVTVATPALSVRSATVDASAGTVNVPVVLGGLSGEESNSTVTVNYTTVDGSATAGTDYVQKSSTLSFAPGETVKNIPVSLLDPAGSAPARSFSIQLSSPTNATIADATGTVVIGAHGATVVALPLISLGPDMAVGAGDGYVDVPVTLSAPSTTNITVNANVANGTASGNSGGGTGTDFLCPYSSCNSGTVTFAPGQTTATLRVELLEDPTASGNESFTVNLSGQSSNAVLARASTRVNIVDNQVTVATPALSVRSATVDASAGTVNVPVVLGGLSGEESNSTVTVNYTTVDGSATAGTDYAQKSGTLSFAPGETVKNIPVSLLDPAGSAPSAQLLDPAVESHKRHDRRCHGHRGDRGPRRDGLALPLISLGPDMAVGAGDGYVDVPVTLSAPSTTNITVNANSSNGTASGNSGGGTKTDFLCPYSSCNSGTVTFAPGQTTATLRVELLEDLSASGNESFTVNLSGQSSNATLARASTRVNIVNNEVIVATPALSVRSATVDASAGTVNVPVVLGGLFGEASNSTVTVNYTTVDGSATAGTDYAQKSGTLSFAPGETVKNIPVSLLDPAGSAPSAQLLDPAVESHKRHDRRCHGHRGDRGPRRDGSGAAPHLARTRHGGRCG